MNLDILLSREAGSNLFERVPYWDGEHAIYIKDDALITFVGLQPEYNLVHISNMGSEKRVLVEMFKQECLDRIDSWRSNSQKKEYFSAYCNSSNDTNIKHVRDGVCKIGGLYFKSRYIDTILDALEAHCGVGVVHMEVKKDKNCLYFSDYHTESFGKLMSMEEKPA